MYKKQKHYMQLYYFWKIYYYPTVLVKKNESFQWKHLSESKRDKNIKEIYEMMLYRWNGVISTDMYEYVCNGCRQICSAQ